MLTILALLFFLAGCSSSNDNGVEPINTALDDTVTPPDTPISEPTDTAASDPIDTPVLSNDLPDNSARHLERALALLTGDPIESAAALAERFTEGTTETGRTPIEADFPKSTAEVIDYVCAEGGTAQSKDTTDATSHVHQRDLEFTNCDVGAFRVDGTLRMVINLLPEDLTPPASYALATTATSYIQINLRYVDERSDIAVELTDAATYFNYPDQSPDDVGLNVNWQSTTSPITITDASGTTSVENLAVATTWIDTDVGPMSRVALGGLDTFLSGTGADSLTSLSVLQQFQRDSADAYFSVGMLEIRGEGFAYLLNAANGDPASFQLTVADDSLTVSYTIPWSPRFNLDPLDPMSVDLGF